MMKRMLKASLLCTLLALASCAHHRGSCCNSQCDMKKDGNKEQCPMKKEQCPMKKEQKEEAAQPSKK
ncbi:MAG: hypothetical protein ACXVLQ_07010 [Bacteriovorax sp.]